MLVALLTFASPAEEKSVSREVLACQREMRKTFEALQAWRRLNAGQYPPRILELIRGGWLSPTSSIYPTVLSEEKRANGLARLNTSRSGNGDRMPDYEYELSDLLITSLNRWMPPGVEGYRRCDHKKILLRRPFAEQVPILRCGNHVQDSGGTWNLTCSGMVYSSDIYWEANWLADVPFSARQLTVLFGAKGPPFHSGQTPAVPEAVDLRAWSNSFGDAAWWWGLPMFDEPPNSMKPPTLVAFVGTEPGRAVSLGGVEWWIDGLTQLQGGLGKDITKYYLWPTMVDFVRSRTGATVNRRVGTASWLQGTIWKGVPGETVGWLVWHYADGAKEEVPLVYGQTTARFWADDLQLQDEKEFSPAAWSLFQSKAETGRDHWVRLYRQDWRNPRPEVHVTTIDFVANTNSLASPFLLSLRATER